jgi:deazaflavin-dependent oxidoreductase (nitroreductase family)
VSLTERLARRLFRLFARANRFAYERSGGSIGGTYGGRPILLLTTTGRRSGRKRTTPLLYLADGDALVLVASDGGAPTHPAWFLNLEANPDVEVQVRREHQTMCAQRASAEERERLWPRLVAMYAPYESYQRRARREIPVVVLEPR